MPADDITKSVGLPWRGRTQHPTNPCWRHNGAIVTNAALAAFVVMRLRTAGRKLIVASLLALTFMSQASMRTLSVGITLCQGEFAFPWPLISAALIVAIVPLCILIALFQERVVGGLTSGGLKG